MDTKGQVYVHIGGELYNADSWAQKHLVSTASVWDREEQANWS